jgi:hypothetical protein
MKKLLQLQHFPFLFLSERKEEKSEKSIRITTTFTQMREKIYCGNFLHFSFRFALLSHFQ